MNKNNGWISIDDELPPYETDVLGLCNILDMQLVLIVSREVGDGECWFSPVGFDGVDTENTVEITHWQPLPQKPEVRNDKPLGLTDLGVVIRKFRMLSGSTLYDMAKQIDMETAELSGIECGRMQPTPEQLTKIAAYLAGKPYKEALVLDRANKEFWDNLINNPERLDDEGKMFTYGSICSGIEAASVAWKGLGKPLWFSEIEPFPCAVLAHHFPDVPNLDDMTALPEKILNCEIPAPDVLVGGTPCQAFSAAGKRESLNDDRGNLTLALIHILEAIDYVRFNNGNPPCVLVWENVPGVLSTSDNAFGHFLAGLAQEYQPLQPTGKRWTDAGYVHSKRTISWRTLDAQYFGVAQRRKRVFVVASARKWSVAQILIEQKGVSRDIEPSKSPKQDITAYAAGGFGNYRQSTVAGTVRANGGDNGGGSETMIVHGTQDPIISHSTAHCLGRNGGQENVLFDIAHRSDVHAVCWNGDATSKSSIDKALTLRASQGGEGVGIAVGSTARKLTPIECERLQGFPDNWTKIPYRNKSADDCPDSPRYKAIGNSMAVPVMRWIGERLADYLEKQ